MFLLRKHKPELNLHKKKKVSTIMLINFLLCVDVNKLIDYFYKIVLNLIELLFSKKWGIVCKPRTVAQL